MYRYDGVFSSQKVGFCRHFQKTEDPDLPPPPLNYAYDRNEFKATAVFVP